VKQQRGEFTTRHLENLSAISWPCCSCRRKQPCEADAVNSSSLVAPRVWSSIAQRAGAPVSGSCSTWPHC